MNLILGDRYNWKNQPERLIYRGIVNGWYQFSKIEEPYKIWCEVPEEDLHMLEKTIAS